MEPKPTCGKCLLVTHILPLSKHGYYSWLLLEEQLPSFLHTFLSFYACNHMLFWARLLMFQDCVASLYFLPELELWHVFFFFGTSHTFCMFSFFYSCNLCVLVFYQFFSYALVLIFLNPNCWGILFFTPSVWDIWILSARTLGVWNTLVAANCTL